MLGPKLCPNGEFSLELFGVRKTFLIQKEHRLSVMAPGITLRRTQKSFGGLGVAHFGNKNLPPKVATPSCTNDYK